MVTKGFSKGWRVGKERVEVTCSMVITPTIYLEPTARAKIELLMGEYPNQEWLAYMQGRISEQNNFFVEDIVVPPHAYASGASAEAEPFHTPEGCIGVIHSHNGMGAFHSGIDQDYVDKNFPTSITVGKKAGSPLEFDAVSHMKTPCGKDLKRDCPVKYVLPPLTFDKDEFLTQAKGNIDKKREFQRVSFIGDEFLPYNFRDNTPFHQQSRFDDNPTNLADYAIDGSGRVLAGQELDDVIRDIRNQPKQLKEGKHGKPNRYFHRG